MKSIILKQRSFIVGLGALKVSPSTKTMIECNLTYVITFQLDLNFRTRDLNPFDGVNNSPLEELKMIVLLCCPLVLSSLASC